MSSDSSRPPRPELTSCRSCVGRRTLLAGAAAVLGAGVTVGAGSGPALAGAPWVDVIAASEVPVGDGYFFTRYAQRWVVTHPARGGFKGFSARCIHQGGICDDVINRAVQCPQHGSRYHLRTGLVVRGPAVQGLTQQPVRVVDRRVQIQI